MEQQKLGSKRSEGRITELGLLVTSTEMEALRELQTESGTSKFVLFQNSDTDTETFLSQCQFIEKAFKEKIKEQQKVISLLKEKMRWLDKMKNKIT